MDNISHVEVRPLEKGSRFVIPVRIDYTQNEKKKTWEAVRAGQSVSCVIFNVTKRTLVCVKQFRPGVYVNATSDDTWTKDDEAVINTETHPSSLGVTLELCGGLVDKPMKSLEEICSEEVYEETGYSVDPSTIVRIGTCRCAVGIAGEPQTLYYVEVTDDMKTGPGGGIDDELIEVVEFSVEDVKNLLSNDEIVAPPELFWGFTWFLLNKT